MDKAHEAMVAAMDYLDAFAPLLDLAAGCTEFSAEALREDYEGVRSTHAPNAACNG
jgi:hypothetical protein